MGPIAQPQSQISLASCTQMETCFAMSIRLRAVEGIATTVHSWLRYLAIGTEVSMQRLVTWTSGVSIVLKLT